MEKVIHPLYRLGALPAQTRNGQPKLHNSFMMSRLPPVKCDKSGIAISPLLGDNNMVGDCTAVGLINSALSVAAMNRTSLNVQDNDALVFYSQSTGYKAGDPTTDNGGVEVDVLQYAFRNGITMGGYPYFPNWGSFDGRSMNSLAMCVVGLGSAYLGLNLALADQTQVGAVFDTTTPGDQTPGSWGGHCAVLWDYAGLQEDSLVTLLTWGTKQKATWRWVLSRITEAHGTFWPQLVSPISSFFSQANFNEVREQNLAFLG